MRVSLNNSYNQAFKGALNNKAMLYSLEKISEHGASFAAGVSFVSAAFLRPFAISMTPNVEKENKQYASANSIASALMKLLVTELVTLPIENGVKLIEKNPEKFLKKETISAFVENGHTLGESKNYRFLTQFIKMGSSFLSAIPKSVLTVAMIPILMDKLFDVKNFDVKKEEKKQLVLEEFDPVFSPVYNNISFKGGVSEKSAKMVSKILDSNLAFDFAKKHSKNDANIPRNMAFMTDITLALLSAFRTKKSDKIKEERKKPLILNTLISTGASILFGGAIDKLVQKGSNGFVEKFIQANKNDPKLAKYLEGINILRPTIIFALIYYGILPVLSTYAADKMGKEK